MTPNFKAFAILGILFGIGSNANAAGESMFSKGHSTWTVSGVTCATSVATDITGSISGFDINAYRLQNQDTAIAVWIGSNANLSTDTTKSNLGEKLTSGSNGVWEVGKNPDLAQSLVKIYCMAADAAGSAGVRLSRAIFGSK